MSEDLEPRRRFELNFEGARARGAGRSQDACPYPLDSLEREAWIEGYDGDPVDHESELPDDQ